MKKLFITACLALAAVTAANAQWYVGGNFSFKETSSHSEWSVRYGSNINGEVESSPLTTVFGIMPRVGYMFNDRWSAGLGIGYEFEKYSPYKDYQEEKTRLNTAKFSPFVRCNLVWFGPFTLGLEASGTYAYTKAKEDGDWKRQDRTRRIYGGEIAPVLSLDVSRRINLECRLNFLSAGYYHSRTIVVAEKDDYTFRQRESSNYASGIFSGDEIFKLGDLTFGMIFKF